MKPFAFYLLTVLLFTSCEKKSIDLPLEPVALNLPEKSAGIIESDNTFGFNIFRQVVENDDASNIFISPTSIALALSMTYNGAEGETKTAFETTLSKQGLTREEINQSYKALINALKSVDPRVILEIANSIWYREGFDVLPEFINLNTKYYNAEVSSLDFASAEAPSVINGWVDDKTHGLIEKIIDNISPDVVMYLINAIYFKGMWKYEFDETKTVEAPFYLKDGRTVSNDFMNQKITVPYLANEKFRITELPYGQGNYSMVILLPNEGYSTADIVSQLTSENWNQWMGSLYERELNISLPKLKFSYKNLLNNELTNLGLGIAFTDMADFSGINGTGGLMISRVLHKSFIEVNEKGTEAAAVTAVEIILTSLPEEIFVTVNRPYLFALRETTTGAVLFLGMVQDPTVEDNGNME